MRYFYKLAEGYPVWPVLHELARKSHLWNANTFRTSFPNTPHVDVDDILLHFSDTSVCSTTGAVIGDTRPIWHPAMSELQSVKPLVMALISQTGGYSLERLLISRVRPGGKILAHADKDGDYVQQTDIARYHVVLQGLPGSLFHCGNETVCMRTGEVWWFNAHEQHAVENNSTDDRIHLLVDLRTW